MYRVLFVCLGNICRSPSAENIMRHLVAEAGLSDQISCDSAGTASYHIGKPPDRRMSVAAGKQGIPMEGKARQFVAQDFQEFDRILAMDADNYREILSLEPKGLHRAKVQMMCEFAQSHSDSEVPDPYYGGPEGFDYVIELLMDACTGLLADIHTNHL